MSQQHSLIAEDYGSCYEILGLDGPCSNEELKKAYRHCVGKYHPDRVTDPELSAAYTEKLQQINCAYRTLTEYEEIFGLLPPVTTDDSFFTDTGGFEEETITTPPPFAEEVPDPRSGRLSGILGTGFLLVLGAFLIAESFTEVPQQAETIDRVTTPVPATRHGADQAGIATSSESADDTSAQAGTEESATEPHTHTDTAHIATTPEVTFDILDLPGEKRAAVPTGLPDLPPVPKSDDEEITSSDLWNPKSYNPVTEE